MRLVIGAKNLPKKCQMWKLVHKPVDYEFKLGLSGAISVFRSGNETYTIMLIRTELEMGEQ